MSPFVKVAREALSELELPYMYRTTPRGSPKRQDLLDKRGIFQVPGMRVQRVADAGARMAVRGKWHTLGWARLGIHPCARVTAAARGP
jgi:hypothetical protein